MSLFVLEIGTEELPARFLPGEETELRARFASVLDEAGVVCHGIRVMSTPRRAVVMLEGVEPLQKEREEVIIGPPVRAAYASDGSPTKALSGFARTHGVDVDALFRMETEKGEYVAVRKKMGGARVADLLAEICPAVITALPFAKRMRWGVHSFAYARPLRWILALFDENVVAFQVGPVVSGRETWGHRIHGPGPFSVPTAAEYLDTVTRLEGITPSAQERRARIIEQGDDLAQRVRGKILWKDGLLDEVQGLCEHPEALLGDIDSAFLEVPREVLLTSMESHQKSFGVEGPDGSLLPHFLTVLNLTPLDKDVVKRGWERVLRARLEDARFFWRTDLAENFDTWLTRLDSVIFLGPLGSMGDKTRRLEKLCAWLARECDVCTPEAAARAGRLSKADLVTGMVGEFDTLQGIMGGIYAERKGECREVAQAIAGQYLPAGPDSPPPPTALGALLSIADKVDTLVGCFGLGMIPTGAADPNGLRRCALGIARNVLEYGFRLDMRTLFLTVQELYGCRDWKGTPEEIQTKLREFFGARLKNLFLSQGKDTLLVEAAMGAGFNDIWGTRRRLAALESLSRRSDYAQLVQTFKRVANIVRKQGREAGDVLTGQWSSILLREEAEKELARTLEKLLPRFDAAWSEDRYDDLPALLEETRPPVDAFFNGVMVMCDDMSVRANRLNLLKALMDRMEPLADFAALQI